MDDSKFAHQLDRALYTYSDRSKSILRSRTYTLTNNLRIAIREPGLLGKKVARLLIRDPNKLKQILLGQRTIQNFDADRERLNREYHEWIERVESKQLHLARQRKEAEALKRKPLVSLITPVFDPPAQAHDKLIRSVMEQTYGNFELLLFNFGKDPAVRRLLDEWAAKDSRVVVKHDLPNERISKNSNLCLEYAKGEYVGLLDHDDALMPNALFECVRAVNEYDADFVYTDKDKISEDDLRNEPLFKPDWSPEMALGGNYLTHFDLMRTKLVRDLGGWDPKTDGAQDWDLFLRILDKTDKVVHVPKIVYHWRTVAGSTSVNVSVKPYALAAQRLAVQKHLDRTGIKARAVQSAVGQMYVEWPVKKTSRSYVIHMRYGDVGQALDLVKAVYAAPDFRSKGSAVFIAVQKESLDDKQKQKLTEAPNAFTLVEYGVGSFVQELTTALKNAKQDTAVYLTDSTKGIGALFDKTAWISQLCGWLTIKDVNAAGAASYGEDGKLVDLGSFFNPQSRSFEKYCFSTGFRSGYNGYIQWLRNFILVSERAFAFNTSLLLTSDWAGLKHAVRDDEFCQALAYVNFARHGRSVYDPAVSAVDTAPFYHSLPMSRALGAYVEKECPGLLVADPYYNPNLDYFCHDPKPRLVNGDPLKTTQAYRVYTTDAAS